MTGRQLSGWHHRASGTNSAGSFQSFYHISHWQLWNSCSVCWCYGSEAS